MAINNFLSGANINEDKLMGPFFLSDSVIGAGRDAVDEIEFWKNLRKLSKTKFFCICLRMLENPKDLPCLKELSQIIIVILVFEKNLLTKGCVFSMRI